MIYDAPAPPLLPKGGKQNLKNNCVRGDWFLNQRRGEKTGGRDLKGERFFQYI